MKIEYLSLVCNKGFISLKQIRIYTCCVICSSEVEAVQHNHVKIALWYVIPHDLVEFILLCNMKTEDSSQITVIVIYTAIRT
jgi:hypothetical protein